MLNIKSHKKIGLHPLSEECMFGKTTEGGGGGQIDLPSAFLGLVNLIKNLKIVEMRAMNNMKNAI